MSQAYPGCKAIARGGEEKTEDSYTSMEQSIKYNVIGIINTYYSVVCIV